MRQAALVGALCASLFCAPASAAGCVPAPGVICAVASGAALSEGELAERLSRAGIVIIGERHDNPRHHEIQARLTGALAPRGLAFEMVPRDKAAAANAARAEGGDLAAALGWAGSGWPDWRHYAPIFAAAPEARIAGGGVGREALNQAVEEGAAAAFGPGAARYGLGARLDEATRAAMIAEQRAAHCDALPEAMLPGMVAAQRVRDAAIADAALRLHEAGRRPVVAIAGNGHARTDRGAPRHLGRAAEAPEIASVGLIELGDGVETWRGYGARYGRPAPPFDFVWFTEAHERGDPCAEFRRSREDG